METGNQLIRRIVALTAIGLSGVGLRAQGTAFTPAAVAGAVVPRGVHSDFGIISIPHQLADTFLPDSLPPTKPAADPVGSPAAPPPVPAPKPAAWTVSSPLNSKIPRWIRFSGEFRSREERRTSFSFKPGANDTYDLTRLRLNMDLTPTSWFHAFVQGQDSHAIGIDPERDTSSVKDVFDLHQAYVDLSAGEHSWIRLRTGRQNLFFGNNRIVGEGDWGNVIRPFDAVLLTLGRDARLVNLFALSPVVIYPNSLDKSLPGQNGYGAYGSFNKLVPGTTIEPYFVWKTLRDVKSKEDHIGDADILTAGTRAVGKLPASFDYEIEMAKQFGSSVNDTISAWAGDWTAGYSPRVGWKPRLSTEVTYASGDDGLVNGRVATFDQVFGAFHNVYGMSDLFGWRNIRQLRGGGEINPTAKLKINLDYHKIGLASAHDGLYNAGGALVVKAPAGGALSRDVGQDLDLYAAYKARPWLTVGSGYGRLFWGSFLRETNPSGTGSSYPYMFMTYRF